MAPLHSRSLLTSNIFLAFVFTISIRESIGGNLHEFENIDFYTPPRNLDSKEKFLRVVMLHLPPEVIVLRNSTGHVLQVRGIAAEVLKWLSDALNFKYIYLPDNIYSVEDNAAGKGLMSAIVEGRADILLGSVTLSANRYKQMNFPHPYIISQFGLIIPLPQAQANVAAVSKPFQNQVWMFFFVSMLATIVCLGGISFVISLILTKAKAINQNELSFYEHISLAWPYVIGVVFSQSVFTQRTTFGNQKLTIRLLAGAWCVTCFVIVTAYSSVLISFVTSPFYKPLIESFYDIPKNPNVKITVDRGQYPDVLFTTAGDGVFKYLGDQLRNDPELRCNRTQECLDKVRNGSYVYIQGTGVLKNYIGINLKRTGQCHFTLAKKGFISSLCGLALPKHVDIENYSHGILKAYEGGFVKLWNDRYLADASRCLNAVRNHEDKKIRLTLGGLSGAFLLLALGLCLSFLTFVMEVITSIFCKP